MNIGIIVVWSVVYVIGALTAALFYNLKVKKAAVSIGASALVFGTVGIIISLLGLDETLFQWLWIAWVFSVIPAFFLALKSPRALFLLIFPVFFVFQAIIPSISLIVLLAAVDVLIGVFNALDFSRLTVTAYVKGADSPFRVLLVPFSKLESLVSTGPRSRKSRSFLFLADFFFSLLLVSLSIAVYVFVGGQIIVGIVLLISCAAYLSIAGKVSAKGTT